MTDDKPAHDRALELFVYAPVGVALYVRDMLPTMMTVFVSRGKREVQSHLPGQPPPVPPVPSPPSPADVRRKVEESLGLARVVTESGLGVAKGVAGTGLGFARGLADTAVQGFGAMQPMRGGAPVVDEFAYDDTPAPEAQASPAAAPPSAPPAASSPASPPSPPSPPSPSAAQGTGAAAAEPAPAVGSLAIPDYDELSASQVVERLEGLDDASLEAIRRYESAHRGRNTILGKIAQLA